MAKEKEIKKKKELIIELEALKKEKIILDLVDPNKITDLSAFSIIANNSIKEECCPVSQFGDLHLDEVVNKNIVNNINEYNQQIAYERAERYFSRLLYMNRKFRKTGTKINSTVIHLVGDFISGWIHEELMQVSTITPIQAIILVQEILIKGIKSILENGDLKELIIICSNGNHSRTTKKNHFKNTFDTSYETLLYYNLQRYFEKESSVKILMSESPYIYYDIYGKINKFSHGNHFNYQGGIGGIEVGLNKWVYRENSVMPFDMAWIGHWHRLINAQKVRINGSVIGYNEMARSYGFTPELPMMQYQLIDKRRGYTYNCPIILTDF